MVKPSKCNKTFNRMVRNTSIKTDRPLDEIYKQARNYAIKHGNIDDDLEEQEDVIKRIMINNIRHKSVNYDSQLNIICSMDRKHKEQNYRQYKNIVLHKIAEAYPFLDSACKKQKKYAPMVKIIKCK